MSEVFSLLVRRLPCNLLVSLGILLTCAAGAAGADKIVFTDVTVDSGVGLSIAQKPPATGAGIAVMDANGDDWYDLVASGGLNLPVVLYLNSGDMKFVAVDPEVSGLSHYGGDVRGLAARDYDNDGDSDIFLANWDQEVFSTLLRNDDGFFVDVTQESGVSVPGSATSGAWGDYDNDGWLDLYVSRYWGQPNLLFHNNQDGTFQNVTAESEIAHPDVENGTQSFQAIWFDVDRDGDVDLYEMNDRCYSGWARNKLFINQGNGSFIENAAAFGLDLCLDAMGVGLNDFDQDGFLDMYISNIPSGNFLLRRQCSGFVDVTQSAGTGGFEWGWGVVFSDFDLDSLPDIYVANAGYVSGLTVNFLFHNQGEGIFDAIEHYSDAWGGDKDSGVVVRADFDRDGDQDLVVGSLFDDQLYTVLRNDSKVGTYLAIRLEGVESNRDGIGAWVEILAGGTWRRQVRHDSETYAGTHEPTLIFGLADIEKIDRVVVYWPSGNLQVIDNVTAGQTLVVVEKNSGIPLQPLFSERCGDAVDNDCDDEVDEGFAVGAFCEAGLGVCLVQGAQVCSADQSTTQCGAVPSPGSEEIGGDGVDNDCDGQVDELPKDGPIVCAGTLELCGDQIDNNCDSHTDEGFPVGESCSLSHGVCETTGQWVCSQNQLEVICDAPVVTPGAEICGDHLDNNCDGFVDEGFPVGETCEEQVMGCQATGRYTCSEDGADVVCADLLLHTEPELCGDGHDNDCDGWVDEGFPVGGVCWVGIGNCRSKGTMECTEDAKSVVCNAILQPRSREKPGDHQDNDCDGQTDEEDPSEGVEKPRGQVDDPDVGSRSPESIDPGLDKNASSSSDSGGCSAVRAHPVAPLYLVIMLILSLCWIYAGRKRSKRVDVRFQRPSARS